MVSKICLPTEIYWELIKIYKPSIIPATKWKGWPIIRLAILITMDASLQPKSQLQNGRQGCEKWGMAFFRVPLKTEKPMYSKRMAHEYIWVSNAFMRKSPCVSCGSTNVTGILLPPISHQSGWWKHVNFHPFSSSLGLLILCMQHNVIFYVPIWAVLLRTYRKHVLKTSRNCF